MCFQLKHYCFIDLFCGICTCHAVLIVQRVSLSSLNEVLVFFSGHGFATGSVHLGELEVFQITRFQSIWTSKGATFYKPVGIPDGFYILGHYCQSDVQSVRGCLLVARDDGVPKEEADHNHFTAKDSPALKKPINYSLIWSSDDWSEGKSVGCGYFWRPQPPEGYKAMGFVVSNKPDMPSLEEVRCVRTDLTENCETYKMILNTELKFPKFPFQVWDTRPCHRGMLGKGVNVGTFFCSTFWSSGDELDIACLKNLNHSLHAMPNLDQIHALIKHYGPTVSFHPDECYLPSSVPWFFKNGAMLFKRGEIEGEPIDFKGFNLPEGGKNDGEYWLDLPNDASRNTIMCGNMESTELYVHVKPALGGTFTDIAMWVFCPFNGPATLKVGMVNIPLSKIGQHVGDWEHFTLRISNFTGELLSIYFSQHSGGEWVDARDLEFIEENKAIVYSTKSGHASFPHPGTYLQGSVGIGVRNDAAWSKFFVDSSKKYEIVAAEYLGDGIVAEPCWLQYMREWGPTIVYNGRSELEKLISFLPVFLRLSVENIFLKIPVELCGEEGPSGPKEKNNWVGDERC
ncbi:hypothetical protein GIB67_006491 [Kingdonia uniflora]|uniref:Vacuolar protein sorting-associated protein 62 n=1 Tax=Kingdonia uniflora TaxID=39325 RepID=A0A7J7LEG9_9MAGN|nr:hypothetical protein GIB67_006491 [Kingdonia uniflora]